MDEKRDRNLILLYGCEPGKRVNADSCLIPRFLDYIKASKLGDGSIVLPGKLHNFTTANGGEAICNYDFALHLSEPNP